MKQNFGLPILGAQSPHEMDFAYIGEVTGHPELQSFATAAGMVIQEDLTNLARSYKPWQQTMIADEVAPRVSVMTETGRYTTWGQEGFDIAVSDQLADDANAGELVFSAAKVSFQIDPRGLQTFVSDRVAKVRGAASAAAHATTLLSHALALRQEIRVRNLADATSNTSTPGTDWDTSTAINTDVAAAQAAMETLLGLRGTHIAFRNQIADEIIGNPNTAANIAAAATVTDGRKYLGMMEGQSLAQVTNPWGLRVLIPSCSYNSANPGLARVKAQVWGDDGFLFHIDRESETSTWAVQLEYLAPVVVSWRVMERGIGGTMYKMFYQRLAKEITPEAVHKLIDLT